MICLFLGHVDGAEHRKALARVEALEQQLSDVRRYLVPMQSWPDLDEHAKGHVAMMLHLTEPKPKP
jgi:hypothetical protein